MNELYDIASEIQKRNDKIARLKERNEEQNSILWDGLFQKLRFAEEFLSNAKESNCRRCEIFSGPHYGPEREKYEKYGTVKNTIKHACNVLRNYHDNAFFRIEGDKAVFGGEWSYSRETEHLSATIPIEWLDLSDDEIEEVVKTAFTIAEEEAARNVVVYERKRKERERAKIEELKAKYKQEFLALGEGK